MTSVPLLIGGATGSVATKVLLQMGFPVRAIVRGDDEGAEPLRALGAEVFVRAILIPPPATEGTSARGTRPGFARAEVGKIRTGMSHDERPPSRPP